MMHTRGVSAVKSILEVDSERSARSEPLRLSLRKLIERFYRVLTVRQRSSRASKGLYIRQTGRLFGDAVRRSRLRANIPKGIICQEVLSTCSSVKTNYRNNWSIDLMTRFDKPSYTDVSRSFLSN